MAPVTNAHALPVAQPHALVGGDIPVFKVNVGMNHGVRQAFMGINTGEGRWSNLIRFFK